LKNIVFIIPFLFFACAKHNPTSQIRETIYQASEDESQTIAQQKAELKIKSEFAKEFGTTIQSQYLKSTQLQNGKAETFSNYNLEEKFKTLVKIKILDHSWENNSYWLKAELSIPQASNQSKKHEKNFLDTERLEKEYEILKSEYEIETIKKREFPETRLGKIKAKIYQNEQLLNQIPSQLKRAEKLKKFSQKIEKLLRDNIYKYENICSESYLVKDCEEFQESKNVLIEIKSNIEKELVDLKFKTAQKETYEVVLNYLYSMREMVKLFEKGEEERIKTTESKQTIFPNTRLGKIEQKIERYEKLLNQIPADKKRMIKLQEIVRSIVKNQKNIFQGFMRGQVTCQVRKSEIEISLEEYEHCKEIIKDLNRDEYLQTQKEAKRHKVFLAEKIEETQILYDQKETFEAVLKGLKAMKYLLTNSIKQNNSCGIKENKASLLRKLEKYVHEVQEVCRDYENYHCERRKKEIDKINSDLKCLNR
jgi:hypothetical protein